jgi:hypothetical protein
MCAGGLFHYNKDSTTYGVARDVAPLFQDEENNPLIKEMASIYILDKLSFRTCKTMKSLQPPTSIIMSSSLHTPR